MTQSHYDPQAFVNQADHMVIDEAQRVPNLFITVKKAVDDDRLRRFVLVGSANFLLLRQIHESLAGRAGYSVLRQPTWSQWHGAGQPSWLLDLFNGALPQEQDTSAAPDIKNVSFAGCLPSVRDGTPAQAAPF